MNIFAGLETFLYVISSGLFYPVVAGLVLLTLWIVISFGGFLREYIDRRQGNSSVLNRYKKTLESEIQLFHVIARYGVPKQSQNEIPRFARNDSKQHNDTLDIRLERFLQEAELGLIKSLDKIRFAIRVGPALGLMGTLIPMGVSLSALAQGDMPKMAGSMVTAFTTTVVGLACGVASYLMSIVKEKWIRADMREMEYMTELTLRNLKLEKEKFYETSQCANEGSYDNKI
ncbi:flagellar motor protein MotA [hot springs metagenome]|uniref:Flagellar motor protein MotA n=1 Tax=hot springs metagenome TaxID=433727 RepID=A0A5J4L0V2_9ZZZZ